MHLLGGHDGTVRVFGGTGRDTLCTYNNSIDLVDGNDNRDLAHTDEFDTRKNLEGNLEGTGVCYN